MVPEGWKKITLGQVSTVVTSGSRDWAKYYAESGSLFIRMTNLRRDSISLKLDDLKYVDVKSESSDGKRTKLVAGDILISITAELGKIGYVQENLGSAYINQHTALVRIDGSKADNKFIAYLLSSAKSNRAINKLNDPGAKAGLNLPAVRSILLEIPLKPEQAQIANILTTWDRVITQTEKLIEAKQKLKKGIMQQLLTGKRRFPGFKDTWHMMSVKDLCTYIGSGGTPSTAVPEYWSGTIPWVTGADFTERGIGVVRRYITDDAVQSSATRVCPKESILLVSRTGVGKIALAPFTIAISQDITVLELTPNVVDPLFILFALEMSLPNLQRFNQGTSINGVMRKDLVCHQILVPSLQEQKKIAAVLLAMNSEIDSLTSCVEQLKEQKRGLMQKLLTGQIRVKATEEMTT